MTISKHQQAKCGVKQSFNVTRFNPFQSPGATWLDVQSAGARRGGWRVPELWAYSASRTERVSGDGGYLLNLLNSPWLESHGGPKTVSALACSVWLRAAREMSTRSKWKTAQTAELEHSSRILATPFPRASSRGPANSSCVNLER